MEAESQSPSLGDEIGQVIGSLNQDSMTSMSVRSKILSIPLFV